MIVRGIVLERKDQDDMGERIRAISDPEPTPDTATPASAPDITQMMQRMQHLHQQGWVFRTIDLQQLEQLLREEAHPADADKVAGWN